MFRALLCSTFYASSERVMKTDTRAIYSIIQPRSAWLELPYILAFNIVIVLSAYVEIPVPGSPVPITGQTFGVMLVAMALGRIRATAVVTGYLLEGAIGLPVFAGGAAGIGHLMGPTGGYLIGFIPAAYITGWLADRGWDRSFLFSALAMAIGHAIVFLCGLAQLSLFVPLATVFTVGLYPFIPGTFLKIAVACAILPGVWRFLNRTRDQR